MIVNISRTLLFLAAIVSLVNLSEATPCKDVPGAYMACSSPCYPNCNDHAYYFNQMIILPDYSECYIDAQTYGYFQVYLSRNGIVNGTAQAYYEEQGICFKNSTDDPQIPLTEGLVYDGSGQCNQNITITVGGGSKQEQTAENVYNRTVMIYTKREVDECIEQLMSTEPL